MTVPECFNLDNAALIFPSIFSERETTLSRIGMTLDSDIDVPRMEDALKKVIQRFPFFQVYLKKGFFSYYYQRTSDIPPLEKDGPWGNSYVNFLNDQFLIRLKYSGPRIIIESSHILTDGFGTLSFLFSLVAEYLRMAGVQVGDSPFLPSLEDEPSPEEWECAYKRTFSSKAPSPKVPGPSYAPVGDIIPKGQYHHICFSMKRDDIKALARAQKVSVYLYMNALYTSCLEDMYLEDIREGQVKAGLPLRMQVPVNLRPDYPSKALRNFSYVYSPEIKVSDKAHDLNTLISLLSGQIRHERHSSSVEHQIARNLRIEKLIFFKVAPRFVKDWIFRIAYTKMARKMFAGVLTNLGDMVLPEGMEEHVQAFQIVPCNSPVPGRNSSLYSYQGVLSLHIGSSLTDYRLEKKMESKLKTLGIAFEAEYTADPLESNV